MAYLSSRLTCPKPSSHLSVRIPYGEFQKTHTAQTTHQAVLPAVRLRSSPWTVPPWGWVATSPVVLGFLPTTVEFTRSNRVMVASLPRITHVSGRGTPVSYFLRTHMLPTFSRQSWVQECFSSVRAHGSEGRGSRSRSSCNHREARER